MEDKSVHINKRDIIDVKKPQIGNRSNRRPSDKLTFVQETGWRRTHEVLGCR